MKSKTKMIDKSIQEIYRFFGKQGIQINKHPVITGLFLEGDSNRVIGFMSGEFLETPAEGEIIEHPTNSKISFVVNGETSLYAGDDSGEVYPSMEFISEALKRNDVPYIDTYKFVEMLDRATEELVVEIDAECLLYFVTKEVSK